MTLPTPAIEAARALGIAHRIVTYGEVRSAEEAARARGVPLAALVKTLVVRVADGAYHLVAIPGDRSIAWPKLRELLGTKRLSLAPQDDLVAATGYARGTVTPFGARPVWPLVVDKSLVDVEEISIGGGGHGMALHVSAADLIRAFSAVVADVSNPVE